VAGLRALAFADRRARSAGARAARAATRASGVITPERAICGVIVASAACLLCSQFVDYRAVEVGRPGYAGLPSAASAPTVGAETPVDAHSYLLVAVAALAGALGVAAARTGRRRLGRVVFLLGLLSVAVVLLVDRPAGLDAGSQASIFSGAAAVLQAGFYAELAAAGGLMLGGMLLTAAPRARKSKVSRRDRPRKVDASRWYRLRKPSLARTQGGLARERTFHVREQAGRLRT
jgi:hypothetical protein